MQKEMTPRGLESKLIKEAKEQQIRDWIQRLWQAHDRQERVLILVELLQWAKEELDGPEIVRQVVRRGNLHSELEDAATRYERLSRSKGRLRERQARARSSDPGAGKSKQGE